MRWRWFWASLAVALAGCGASETGESRTLAPTLVAKHYKSAGDSLLELAPRGASVVLEIDLERLRGNQAIAPLYSSLVAGDVLRPDFAVFRDASSVAVCAYAVGTADASTLTLFTLAGGVPPAKAKKVSDGVFALASGAVMQRVAEVQAGTSPSMLSDDEFMAIRDRAVPKQAPGAALRLAGSFGFESRVTMARMFDLDRVPTSISLWGDVVDDFAMVAILEAENPKAAVKLSDAATAWLGRLAEQSWVRRLVLGYLVRSVNVKTKGRATTAVLVIDPHRLNLLVKRLSRLMAPVAEKKIL